MPPDKPPSTVHVQLERAFRQAKAPGSLATSLTVSPDAAADLAARIFAAFLRDEAAAMRQGGWSAGAKFAESMARDIDPLGSVMGAPAAGGTS